MRAECIDTIDIEEMLQELISNRDLFGRSPRTMDGLPHMEVEDIILRGPDPEIHTDLKSLHEAVDCIYYPDAEKLPFCKFWAEHIYKTLGGRQLGRVLITRLPPFCVIYPHRDEGPVPEFYDRYHLCLFSSESNVFLVADDSICEAIQIEPGQLWRIDVSKRHSVVNMSETNDRIHMILDVAT